MRDIVVITPIEEDKKLDPRVEDSIKNQNVNVVHKLIPNKVESMMLSDFRKDLKNSDKDRVLRGWKSQTKAREDGRRWALENYDHPYFLFLNSYVIFSTDHDIEDMMNFLDKNEEYGATGLSVHGQLNEYLAERISVVDIACMLIRRYVLERVSIKVNKTDNSVHLGHDMRRLSKYKKSKYLDTRRLIDIRKI